MAAENRTRSAYSLVQSSEPSESWELIVYDRHGRRVFRLPEAGVTHIGRAANSDVRLEHDSVSRQHARIHLPDLEVEDLDSCNGSWLVEPGPRVTIDSVAERADPGTRLLPGVRRRFVPGSMLKLGEVVCQVEPSAPVVHTLPVAPPSTVTGPVFEDAAMVELYRLATRVASTGLPLLILGETGVGKDVMAAEVHRASPRGKGPFVRINCGALSESLLESELFGHQRGAFTGASDSKPGLFELGQGGSVFLDEIGELPLRTQVKLLHVLETNQVTRVGATKPQSIDVRFIAATNRELARDVQIGSFRKDLYFRVNTLCLKINPLRERKSDVLPLVRHFLRRACAGMGAPEPELSPAAICHLEAYRWPGNVRELKNSVERARLLCGSGPLLPEHFPTERELVNSAPDFTDIWAEAELPTQVRQRPVPQSGPASSGTTDHAALLEALNSCGGNQTRAAELLGISRRTLVNRLNVFNVPRPRKGRS